VLAAEVLLAIVIAGFGFIYENVSAARASRRYPAPGKLVDVGGYRLHLDCAGQGTPTVVLIYGMSGSYLDWFWVQPEIAKFTRVCSYDRPGYGWSELSTKPRLASIAADELHTLLVNAGEKPPFILVGHSLGGFDALMYAHKFAGEVSGMVLIDAAHPDWNLGFSADERRRLRFLQFTAPFGIPRWRKWCVQGPPVLAVRKAAFNCQSRIFKANYELWDAYPQSAREMRALGSLGTLPLVVISRDPDRGARNVDSEKRWAQLQENLAGLSSNSTHVVAKGIGHAIPLDDPNVVVEQTRKLVERLRSEATHGR
jgi:pimeloyl-ACP methyl ester carboxylesterase